MGRDDSLVADGTRRVALCGCLVCVGHGSGCASSEGCFEMREGGVCVDCEWWLRRGVVGIVSGKMEFGFCQSTKQLDSHWLCPQLGAAGPHLARALVPAHHVIPAEWRGPPSIGVAQVGEVERVLTATRSS